jgi:hypothetical protein
MQQWMELCSPCFCGDITQWWVVVTWRFLWCMSIPRLYMWQNSFSSGTQVMEGPLVIQGRWKKQNRNKFTRGTQKGLTLRRRQLVLEVVRIGSHWSDYWIYDSIVYLHQALWRCNRWCNSCWPTRKRQRPIEKLTEKIYRKWRNKWWMKWKTKLRGNERQNGCHPRKNEYQC